MSAGEVLRSFGHHAAFLLLTFLLSSFTASAQTVVPQAQTPAIPHRLTLAEAEQLLLQRNLAITAARYQIDANRAARLIASYKPNPVLTVGAEQFALNGNFFHNLVRTDPNQAAASTYTVRVDKVIERGGKRELRTEQAEAQLKAAEAQMLDALRTQLFQLRQAFTTATLARENLLLAEATRQQYEQTAKLTEIRVENGDLAGVEVFRVRAGLLQYEQAVLQARTSYEQSVRDVLNLLGAKADQVAPATKEVAAAGGEVRFEKASLNRAVSPEQSQWPDSLRTAPLEIAGTFDDRQVTYSLTELRQMALSERPDVQAARHLFEAAGHGVALARAQRTRDISVGVEYQHVGSDSSVGATMSIPLFVHNNHLAEAAQAEALQKSAEAQLRQAETQAVTDVEKAYQAYLTARRTLELYSSQNLTQMEKLRSIAAFSFREGASSLLELLDAQRSYNQAITAYNQARADYQMSLWQLEQAVGKPLR
ncbi:MAG TPA: TolC family protein [Blastocatellia bacterium]|nr:TolC family protein [Blastocatellia bacterium]